MNQRQACFLWGRVLKAKNLEDSLFFVDAPSRYIFGDKGSSFEEGRYIVATFLRNWANAIEGKTEENQGDSPCKNA